MVSDGWLNYKMVKYRQSFWLQIQRSGFDSRRCQIFLEVVGLDWGSLSLVCKTEELLEKKKIGTPF
jgi:hypothetical protein